MQQGVRLRWLKSIKDSVFAVRWNWRLPGTRRPWAIATASSCRHWSAGPVNAFTLWKPEAVKVTKGAEFVATFTKNPSSERQFCSQCGGHLMTNHPGFGLIDIYAAILPSVEFKPGVHVNYAETVLPIKDGLPKLKDFPAELGGSGESVPE